MNPNRPTPPTVTLVMRSVPAFGRSSLVNVQSTVSPAIRLSMRTVAVELVVTTVLPLVVVQSIPVSTKPAVPSSRKVQGAAPGCVAAR